MKKVGIGIFVSVSTFFVGILIATVIGYNVRSADLQNEVRVTWQDDLNSCGQPRKSFFDGEWIVIDNPLCKFSPDLHEIPHVGLSDFFLHPKPNDGRIVRVDGQYTFDPSDPFKSRFFMFDDILGRKHFGMGYWDRNIYTQIGDFLHSNKKTDNTVDVRLVIQLIDVTGNPGAFDHNGNTPFNITILHIEQIK